MNCRGAKLSGGEMSAAELSVAELSVAGLSRNTPNSWEHEIHPIPLRVNEWLQLIRNLSVSCGTPLNK